METKTTLKKYSFSNLFELIERFALLPSARIKVSIIQGLYTEQG